MVLPCSNINWFSCASLHLVSHHHRRPRHPSDRQCHHRCHSVQNLHIACQRRPHSAPVYQCIDYQSPCAHRHPCHQHLHLHRFIDDKHGFGLGNGFKHSSLHSYCFDFSCTPIHNCFQLCSAHYSHRYKVWLHFDISCLLL